MSGEECPDCGETLENATPEQIEKFTGNKCECGINIDCCTVELGISFFGEEPRCYMCETKLEEAIE